MVLIGIFLIFGSLSVLNRIININKVLGISLNPAFEILGLICLIIDLVIYGIFFVKLFNVRPDVIKWLHISFGFSIGYNVIISFLTLGLLSIPFILITLLFGGMMWLGIFKHLTRAERDNLMDFS